MDGIANDFLNGMPFREFIVLYVWALAGTLLMFWRAVDKGIKTSPKTSNKFEWRYFWKGVRRTISTLVLIAVVIIYWPEISGFLFQADTVITLTGWSAFLIVGVGSDKITETVFGESEQGWNYLKKKFTSGKVS